MRRYLLSPLAILLLLSFVPLRLGSVRAASAPARSSAAAAGDYRPGAVLVKFQTGAAARGRAALAAEGLAAREAIPALDVWEVAAPVGEEQATAAQLAQRNDVVYAELDYRVRAQAEPNDPYYLSGKQWGLTRIGAPQAWDVTTGAAGVIIAVVDSGADLNHPDLTGKLWKNAGEIPNNGRDDDGNGYVDDVNGWHFFHAYIGNNEYEPRGDKFVMDDNGHGTHVAGIAGAATNNGVGVAGVSWQSPLMAIKVLDQFGYGWDSDIAQGILYAAANSARVINLSLGGPNASQTECDAIAAAMAKSTVVVAAVGNNGNAVLYPAMCPGALAVAATDQADQKSDFSVSGPRVDLAAPGQDIWSTWYLTGLAEHTYRLQAGTSQAAPFVSGAAALVWSRWPALTADGVKAQLLGTVQDVGMPGKDDGTGWGRLDVASAVAAPAAAVDLRLTAAVAPQTVVAGNPLTATFTIANAGAASASSVTLSALLPAEPTIGAVQFSTTACRLSGRQMDCGVSRLDPGESVTIGVVVTPTVVGSGELVTTASVSAAQRELTPADNSQTIETAIRPVLSGRVFIDSNGDGIREAWETRGVSEAHLFLEQNGLPIGLATSQSPGGEYAFDTLAPGSYVLRAELPPGYQFTTPQEIALLIEPARETVVYFGAWNGTPEPTPTMTPTPTATPEGQRKLYLPVVVH